MSDKRATASAAPNWVQPQPQPTTPGQMSARPTHKGEISTGRVLGFLMLAFAVASAIGYLAFTAWGVNAALAWFVIVLLGVFTPYFLIDSAMSSGYLHHKAEIGLNEKKVELDDKKVDLAILHEAQLNVAQQAAIEAIQDEIALVWEQIDALKTVRIQDRDGIRIVAKHDEIDSAIDSWLSKSMFDAKGQLVGAHPSGVLKQAYPFKGNDNRSQLAHQRLMTARLVDVRKPSNQYAWVGPRTLTDTKRILERLNSAENGE